MHTCSQPGKGGLQPKKKLKSHCASDGSDFEVGDLELVMT